MRSYLLCVIAISGLGVCFSDAVALSVGAADLFYASYGQARHFDQSNEFLGSDGMSFDGVTFSPFIPGETAHISIEAAVGQLFGSGDFEYLSIWVDWDQSRFWEDDEEIIDLDDVWFAEGSTSLDFEVAVPDDAILGNTWLRARFSFDGDLTRSGDYFTGEVEDYEIAIGATQPIPEPGSLALLGVGLLALTASGWVTSRCLRFFES